eukprot:5103845-Pyramimonas_sp.AAC.1
MIGIQCWRSWRASGSCPRVARADKHDVNPLSFMRAGVLAYCAWGGEVECKCVSIVRSMIAYVPSDDLSTPKTDMEWAPRFSQH